MGAIRRFWRWLISSVWAFPALLFVLLLLLTSLRISGTSAGTYHLMWYGGKIKDHELIYGTPRAIRSDEWLVTSQIIVSQSRLGYPRVNPDLGPGQDLSLQTEIPTKDWPTIFKPQLWSFFILPVQYAFAFKWWFLMFALIASCYLFVLRLLPGRKWFAIIFSLGVGLSPFMLWWYQSSVFLSLTYGFLISILVMRILNGEPIPFIKDKRLVAPTYILALAFLLICFGLLFYPPFQIPVAICVLFFSLGFALNKLAIKNFNFKILRKPLMVVLAALLVTVLIGGTFYETHKRPIKALSSSVYPGHRRIDSGGLNPLSITDSFLMPIEQSDSRGAHFFQNQSEASNFILLLPFLLLPGIGLMVWEWVKKKKPDWLFLAIQLCAVLFFVRAFVPYGSGFFRLLLLDRVPQARLIIGFGFIGILQVIYFTKKLDELKPSRRFMWPFAVLYGFAGFLILAAVGVKVWHRYPLFMSFSHDLWLIGALSGLFSLIVIAFLVNRRAVAAILFLAFTLISSYRIIPLYQGLNILTSNRVVTHMRVISKPSDTWVTVGGDAWLYEDFGALAGRHSLSGPQLYPTNAWANIVGMQYKNIYDREGHALFVDDPSQIAPVKLLQADAFAIKFQCSPYIENNVQFALSVHELSGNCLKLRDKILYPGKTFYLYQVR